MNFHLQNSLENKWCNVASENPRISQRYLNAHVKSAYDIKKISFIWSLTSVESAVEVEETKKIHACYEVKRQVNERWWCAKKVGAPSVDGIQSHKRALLSLHAQETPQGSLQRSRSPSSTKHCCATLASASSWSCATFGVDARQDARLHTPTNIWREFENREPAKFKPEFKSLSKQGAWNLGWLVKRSTVQFFDLAWKIICFQKLSQVTD